MSHNCLSRVLYVRYCPSEEWSSGHLIRTLYSSQPIGIFIEMFVQYGIGADRGIDQLSPRIDKKELKFVDLVCVWTSAWHTLVTRIRTLCFVYTEIE